jgi:hypothetical protein
MLQMAIAAQVTDTQLKIIASQPMPKYKNGEVTGLVSVTKCSD